MLFIGSGDWNFLDYCSVGCCFFRAKDSRGVVKEKIWAQDWVRTLVGKSTVVASYFLGAWMVWSSLGNGSLPETFLFFSLRHWTERPLAHCFHSSECHYFPANG
jgi:hypothetical protein